MNGALSGLELGRRVVVAVDLVVRVAATTARLVRVWVGCIAESLALLSSPTVTAFALLSVARLWAALRLVDQASNNLPPDATTVSVRPWHSSIPNPLSSEED